MDDTASTTEDAASGAGLSDEDPSCTSSSAVAANGNGGMAADPSRLIEEIGRLARLVGYLRAENERLAAERQDLLLRLRQLQQQGSPENSRRGNPARPPASAAGQPQGGGDPPRPARRPDRADAADPEANRDRVP
jgi:hypothetical protein